jgi:hypothetical protein
VAIKTTRGRNSVSRVAVVKDAHRLKSLKSAPIEVSG